MIFPESSRTGETRERRRRPGCLPLISSYSARPVSSLTERAQNCGMAPVFRCASETGALPQFCARSVSDENGRAEYEEISGKHPGRRLRSRVSPVRDDSGKIIAYLMVVRDITETVAHEREINRRQHAARF